MTRSKRSVAKPKRIEPRAKVWLEIDSEYVFGFGLAEILKAVEATGSIKAGANQLAKSYRYVWGRIKKAEKALGRPLVDTQVGGRGTSRSSLTVEAVRLVADFDALRDRVFEIVDREFSSRFR